MSTVLRVGARISSRPQLLTLAVATVIRFTTPHGLAAAVIDTLPRRVRVRGARALASDRGGTAAKRSERTVLARRMFERVLLGLLLLWVIVLAWQLAFNRSTGLYGVDFRTYRDAAASWLAGSGFYRPWQLTGTYDIWAHPPTDAAVMYPPVALWLFVPFVFLPAWLWWAIPVAAIAWSLWRLKPSLGAWIAILAIFDFWPCTPDTLLWGNPQMWTLAALFLGTVYRWPSVFVLMKPSLLPFAAWGTWEPRWWLALGLGLLACVPLGALWLEYAKVMLNSNGTLAYSMAQVPVFAIPLVAWAGRSVRPSTGVPRVDTHLAFG